MRTTEEAKRLLNESHTWPCLFAFKFIVPAAEEAALKALLTEAVTCERRDSSAGKYAGLTFRIPVGSADEVLGIYARVNGITGLIAL